MPVQKNERALVVISEINQHAGDFAWLYNFAENAGRWQVESTLKDDYVDYVSLYDQSATKNNLVSTLKALGGKPTIKEIDLIVMLHGNTNRLVFHEGRVYMSELKNDIQGLNLAKKLRLVYSTACYGQTHINEFIGAGFSTAIGAKGINSSGATELPVFVRLWSYGIRADQALAVADNQLARAGTDAAAKVHAQVNNLSWKNDNINSEKVIDGTLGITINYDSGGT